MLTLIKLILTNLIVGLWDHTKALFVGVYDRVVAFFAHILLAVKHIALIPVHAVLWVLGCLHVTWTSLKAIWGK